MFGSPTKKQLLARINELESQLTHDQLTGLLNKKGFVERLAVEIALTKRNPNHTIHIVSGDMDHFKWINDRFGHATGDETLKHVAKILLSSTREVDFAARPHGDEFLIGLLDTTNEKATIVLNRIQTTLATHPLVINGQQIKPKITLATVLYNIDQSVEEVIVAADKAMLARKDPSSYR